MPSFRLFSPVAGLSAFASCSNMSNMKSPVSTMLIVSVMSFNFLAFCCFFCCVVVLDASSSDSKSEIDAMCSHSSCIGVGALDCALVFDVRFRLFDDVVSVFMVLISYLSPSSSMVDICFLVCFGLSCFIRCCSHGSLLMLDKLFFRKLLLLNDFGVAHPILLTLLTVIGCFTEFMVFGFFSKVSLQSLHFLQTSDLQVCEFPHR